MLHIVWSRLAYQGNGMVSRRVPVIYAQISVRAKSFYYKSNIACLGADSSLINKKDTSVILANVPDKFLRSDIQYTLQKWHLCQANNLLSLQNIHLESWTLYGICLDALIY